MSSIDQDPYGILTDMEANGSYVKGSHIVYKAGTHGEKYLDKDAHLKQPGVARNVTELLARSIIPGAVIIAPETRSETNLGQAVAKILGNGCISTRKVHDRHTFEPRDLQGLHGQYPVIMIDDIFNNGETLNQILEGLRKCGLTLHAAHFMVNRNPAKSLKMGISIESLATVQMDQWNEADVPEELRNKAINTSLGRARNWVPAKGQELAAMFLAERLAKEKLGFYFDDGREVVAKEGDELMLVARE